MPEAPEGYSPLNALYVGDLFQSPVVLPALDFGIVVLGDIVSWTGDVENIEPNTPLVLSQILDSVVVAKDMSGNLAYKINDSLSVKRLG